MAVHVNVTIGLEGNAFLLQQRALTAPSGRRAPLLIDHTVARQLLGSWGIAECAPHHPRMTRPASPCSNHAVSGNLPAGYLTHDIQHVLAKPPCLLRRHLIWIVLHHSDASDTVSAAGSARHAPWS